MMAMMRKKLDSGKPFDRAAHALLTTMVAQVNTLRPGDFVHTLGDAHLHSNHFEQARLQPGRTPRTLPAIKINPEVKDIFSFTYEDFELVGYDADPTIKVSVAV